MNKEIKIKNPGIQEKISCSLGLLMKNMNKEII